MCQSCFSIGINRIGYVHFESFRILAQTHTTVFRDFAHYDREGNIYGKSVRNIKGDLIHYDAKGWCVGFSTHSAWGKITHYNSGCGVVGYSRIILWFLLIHHKINEKER